ncbi:ABC transporter ATP-binding protein [Pseudomonadales bacterium]|nr:ABC transporter ATP-binding protein [Pseudomonadales bacterium]MDA9297400.1 ABC transporter ATP-binding protein [Pseudomonadales bacterium]MDA9366497.1 ABC transporter ATP-binding protein [Pseudomonadales bacterium]MDB9867740.1 ABC transporter ATP-binding protein [Pseudomonadales bacterium]MDB9880067.1 ABC transporter ATP-binding protein [Pseudomonadales bacterium]
MAWQATDIDSSKQGAAGSGAAGSGAAGSGAAGKPRVVFDVQGLTRVYQAGGVAVHALRGVDLQLYDGEFVVLLGASGSGKSTLLNILGGLDTATAGQVLYTPAASQKQQQVPQTESSYDLTHATEKQLTDYRRHHVGFVFQFYNLIPSLTARENITVVTEIALQPMQPEDALALVNLTERQDHFPAQLSGGEQQRVAIARAVAKNPAVLLCDEPTGALDSKTGIVVLEALQRANNRLGTTTVVITHNVTIAQIADRVIQLVDGKISRVSVNENRCSPSDLHW